MSLAIQLLAWSWSYRQALANAYGEVNSKMEARIKISLLHVKVKCRSKPTTIFSSYKNCESNMVLTLLGHQSLKENLINPLNVISHKLNKDFHGFKKLFFLLGFIARML